MIRGQGQRYPADSIATERGHCELSSRLLISRFRNSARVG